LYNNSEDKKLCLEAKSLVRAEGRKNMSQFSGKNDLADTIFMQKMYPMYPNNENSPLISNEMECFNIFKEKTGGVIHQHFKLELSESNIDFEIKNINNPKILSKREVPHEDDKNHTKPKYVYIYWGKEYNSIKEINKKGYHATKSIRFNTLLDIIPYYPHIVSFMSGGEDGKLFVVISGQSYVDHQEEEARKYGYKNEMTVYYRNRLQEHYVEVVNKYFKEGK
jgi:hypothetical protein